MGTTFSAIHIYNKRQESLNQYADKLKRYMKRKKLVPTSKGEAQYSFSLTFSLNDDWVTLCSEEFDTDTDSFSTEVAGLSKSFKTCCIGTVVVDSDILYLFLHDVPSKRNDIVVVGNQEFVEEITGMDYTIHRGDPDCWNQLLTAGYSWEELTDVWDNEYVFVEEALIKMAPLIGIERKNIGYDFQNWHNEDDSKQQLIIYFRNDEPVFFYDEPTRLTIRVFPIFTSGRADILDFNNSGGVSKGLAIVIHGYCIDDETVDVNLLSVEWVKDPHIKGNEWYNAREVLVLLPVLTRLPNGRTGLIFNSDDFVFPVGINEEHPSMRGEKGFWTVSLYSVLLRFEATIISGDNHEFNVTIVPHSNPEGSVSACIPIHLPYEE